MKTSRLAALAAVSLGACALVPSVVIAGNGNGNYPLTDPITPVGIMTAFPTIVQTGTKPTLTWNILHPSKVSDLALINPPGTIIPKEDVFVSVQVIGTDPVNCQGGGNSPKLPTDLRLSLNGGSYSQLFYGTQDVVNPSHVLYTKKVFAGQTVDFGGRYVSGGAWSPFYTTRNSNIQVVSLVNGDVIPVSYQYQGQGKYASYLKPYVNSSNQVQIGPLSILILMELGQTNHGSPCFDYQDQVVLVTLSRKHPNNGHGNNLDGVDSSNPGNGKGGPNGEIDPSGDYDDEIR